MLLVYCVSSKLVVDDPDENPELPLLPSVVAERREDGKLVVWLAKSVVDNVDSTNSLVLWLVPMEDDIGSSKLERCKEDSVDENAVPPTVEIIELDNTWLDVKSMLEVGCCVEETDCCTADTSVCDDWAGLADSLDVCVLYEMSLENLDIVGFGKDVLVKLFVCPVVWPNEVQVEELGTL